MQSSRILPLILLLALTACSNDNELATHVEGVCAGTDHLHQLELGRDGFADLCGDADQLASNDDIEPVEDLAPQDGFILPEAILRQQPISLGSLAQENGGLPQLISLNSTQPVISGI